MAYWWDNEPSERSWVEIRKQPGIGTFLFSPTTDDRGRRNPWYDLVGSVQSGDRIYHYNARESRFVGRSWARDAAVVDESGLYRVSLEGFEPIAAPVDLAFLRSKATEIYGLRDELGSRFGSPLYLPFQFTADPAALRMMSNYFTKLPNALALILFGRDGLAGDLLHQVSAASESAVPRDRPVQRSRTGRVPVAFLDPFQPKADTDYVVRLAGGPRTRQRNHESLVNACASWLAEQGLIPGRNAAIDLGILKPPMIIEAKIVSSWSEAIRQAVGQLYEYRYFRVADPGATLVFLSDRPVPGRWLLYLEQDRRIEVMWPTSTGYRLSSRCREVMGLS